MIPSRRSFLLGAAALGSTVVTPDVAEAARLISAQEAVTSDWGLVTRDVERDLAPHRLTRIHGRAPAGLEGALYRNGPAKFRRPGGSAEHWFDGDGLIRRFGIADGQATLSARFADTPKRRQEAEMDAMVVPGFGSPGDPRARIGSNDDANAANTSVLRVGDDLWALWEGGSPMAMDPDTLETRGFVTLRDDLKSMPFLAHPRVERDGRIWNLGMNGTQAIVWRLAADGALEDARVVRLPRASYVHDFTATARHLVIVLQPWVQVRQTMPFSSGFEWQAGTGTRVLVLDKDDLDVRREFELPDFGFFHLGEAWEEADGTIRFDVCATDDMRFAAAGASKLLNGVPVGGEPARLALAALRPDGSAQLERTAFIAEFPRSDPRRAGLARRYSLHTSGEHADRPFASAVGLYDWSTGRDAQYDFGPDQVVEEMVVVPKPGRSGETDAWLVGPTINLREQATELHVLDMARLADGPVASWRSHTAVPAGFHGIWAG